MIEPQDVIIIDDSGDTGADNVGCWGGIKYGCLLPALAIVALCVLILVLLFACTAF